MDAVAHDGGEAGHRGSLSVGLYGTVADQNCRAV